MATDGADDLLTNTVGAVLGSVLALIVLGGMAWRYGYFKWLLVGALIVAAITRA